MRSGARPDSTMKDDRLRRALLPTWPPQSVSEAMLLLCAAALHLLLALWLLPGGSVPSQPDVAEAALASLGALARPMALALLLALAARVVLRVAPVLALGLGALLTAGTCVAPLAQGLGGAAPAQAAWLGPLCTALLALPATRLAGRPAWTAALLAPLAAALVAAVAHYDAAHGWLLDAAGLSVRGALAFSLEQARREGLDAVPLLVLCLLAWLAAGGKELRRALLLAWRGGAWPLAVAGAACLAWGYVRAGVALDALPGILQPPAIYGLVVFLAGLGALLAMVALLLAHLRQGEPRPSAGTLGLLAAWGGVLTWLGADAAPIMAALIVLPVAAPLFLRPGRWWSHRPMSPICGAGLALLLWIAGVTLVPGVGFPKVPFDSYLLPGLLAAGAGFRLVHGRAGRRPVGALGVALLCAGLAGLALEAGRGDMIVLCGVMFLLLELGLLLPRGPRAAAGDAAFCCLALLGAATALSAG